MSDDVEVLTATGSRLAISFDVRHAQSSSSSRSFALLSLLVFISLTTVDGFMMRPVFELGSCAMFCQVLWQKSCFSAIE